MATYEQLRKLREQQDSGQNTPQAVAPPGGAQLPGADPYGTDLGSGGSFQFPSGPYAGPGPNMTSVMPGGDGLTPGGGGGVGGVPPGPTPPQNPPGSGGGGGGGVVPGGGGGVPYAFDFGPAPTPGEGPSAPSAGPLTGQLGGFAGNALQNPSRFDIGLVQDVSAAIDQELGRAQEQAFRTLDERMASRGLTGSNVEAEMGRRATEDIEQQRLQRMNALNMALAQTAAQDRQTAANIGLGVNQQTFGQGMEQARFGEGQRRFDFGAQIQSRAQELQRQGMEADEAFRQAQLEWEQEFGGQRLGLEERLRTRDQRLQMLSQLLSVLGMTGFQGESFEDLSSAFGPQETGGPQGPPGDPRFPTEEEEEEDTPGPGDPRYR